MKYSAESQSIDRIVGTGNRLIESINKNSKAQEKHQKSIFWLTVVIAFSTTVYTGVTIWSTLLQYNELELKQNQVSFYENQSSTVVTIK